MENETVNTDTSALIARLEALEAEKAAMEVKVRQLLDEKKKLQASFVSEKEQAESVLAQNLAGVAEKVASLEAIAAESAKKATEAERKAVLIEAGITGSQLELAMFAVAANPEYIAEGGAVDVTKLVTKYQTLVSGKPKQTTPQPVAGGANISNAVASLDDAKARLAQTGNIAEYADFLAAATKKSGVTRT